MQDNSVYPNSNFPLLKYVSNMFSLCRALMIIVRYDNKIGFTSLQVLLWEVLSFGESPFPNCPADTFMTNLRSGQKLNRPFGCPQVNNYLAIWHIPKSRPDKTLMTWADSTDLFLGRLWPHVEMLGVGSGPTTPMVNPGRPNEDHLRNKLTISPHAPR